jgi:hypothetical protein
MLVKTSPYFGHFSALYFIKNNKCSETCCQQRYYLARELMLLDREEKVSKSLLISLNHVISTF